VPGELRLPDGAELRAEFVAIDPMLREQIVAGRFDDGRTVFLDGGAQPLAFLRVRHWQPGDRYVPLGSAHASKLQDQFVNRRIDRALRRQLPVVLDAAGGISWVPGLPPAHGGRIEPKTRVAVQLTYRPADPLSFPPHGR
jgi:tRNA(Ile)-lysidine synthetase-like protein